jgi:chemotaxis protein MotB
MFAFFTTLYAISVVAVSLKKRLVHSIKESFGEGAFDIAKLSVLEHALGTAIELEQLAPPQTPIQSAAERIQNLTLPKNIRESMTVRETERGLVITLAETLLFESGGTALSSDAKGALAEVAGVLRDLPNHVRVEGHTDSRPPSGGPHPTNWHLSAARAVEVLLEIAKAGVPGHRLSTAGFGDQRPLASNRTAEGQKMNRRVDLVVIRVKAPSGG